MYKVLLLDDEPWELIGLEKTFGWTAMGFEVIDMLSDPVDAFDAICLKKPDAVFTDIRMPDINGIQLMKMTREQGLDIEFIAISGFAEFVYAQEALRQGAFDYLVKPVLLEDAGKLLARLAKRLEEKKDARQAGAGRDQETDAASGIDEIIRYVNKNYKSDLSLRDVAEKHHMNHTYCSECFKKAAGKTFSDYIRDLRMKAAGEYLAETGLTIADICARVGYKDYYYFNKVFKRYFGATPAKYRINARRKSKGHVEP